MTAEAARWYDSPRLGGSPNTGGVGGGGNGIGPLGNSHAAAAVAAANGGLDASDMGAFYALENGSRRYYSGHYSPHGKCLITIIMIIIGVSLLECFERGNLFEGRAGRHSMIENGGRLMILCGKGLLDSYSMEVAFLSLLIT